MESALSDAEKIQMGESISENPACQRYQVPKDVQLWLIHHLRQRFVKLKCYRIGWQLDQLSSDLKHSPVEEKRHFKPICYSNCTMNIDNIKIN